MKKIEIVKFAVDCYFEKNKVDQYIEDNTRVFLSSYDYRGKFTEEDITRESRLQCVWAKRNLARMLELAMFNNIGNIVLGKRSRFGIFPKKIVKQVISVFSKKFEEIDFFGKWTFLEKTMELKFISKSKDVTICISLAFPKNSDRIIIESCPEGKKHFYQKLVEDILKEIANFYSYESRLMWL